MRKLLLCFFVLLLNLFSSAQPGALDLTFNPSDVGFGNGDGASGQVTAIATQSDGKILVGGDFTFYNNTSRIRIVRLNADGTLDTSFDPGSGADGGTPSSAVTAIAVQSDGKILVGGWFATYNGVARRRIARLNSDGSLDASFNPGTGANSTIYNVTLQPDGKILITGNFASYNGTGRNNIARLNSDGSLDATFNPGTGANGVINTLALRSDGKILIGGSFTSYNGTGRNSIARLNSDGSLDASFNPGTGANSGIRKLELQTDGKIMVAGDFNVFNGTAKNRLVRLTADGALDASFDPVGGPNNTVFHLRIQSDNKILISGNFTTYNGTVQNRIARLNSDGSLDAEFANGVGGDRGVYALALQADNKVLIGGDISIYNNETLPRIGRLNTDGTRDILFNPITGVNGSVSAIVVQPDKKILIAGVFQNYNGITRNFLARLNSDGSTDVSFNPGVSVNSNIYSMAIQSDGKIIIGGDFSTYNNLTRGRIARLNSDGSLDASFTTSGGADNRIYSIAVQSDGKILVGGDFTTYNGTARNRIARLNSDGSLDVGFNPGTGANNSIRSIIAQTDGNILVAGLFTTINGVTRNRIARLLSTGALDNTIFTSTGTDSDIYSMLLQSDGKIVIGGSFNFYGGAARNKIARINTDGSVDASFLPGTGANSTIVSIAQRSDGKITFSGYFSMFNGQTRNGIARVNTDGTLDGSFNPGTGASALDVIALNGDDNLLIGGRFTSYNGTGRNRIALINNSVLPTITTGALSSTSFCAGSTISVPFTATGSFTAGNTFTAQLSDASGSFAVPVAIGTLSSTTAGTITATIPTSITSGAGYRIRVVSSNPIATGSDNGRNLTLTALATVNDLTNLAICNSASLPTTAFAGSAGASYTWTNSNTAIGLAASGKGNLPAFAAINTGTSAITSTVTVTPKSVIDGYAYIANYSSNNVSVINLTTNTVSATVPVGTNPFATAVSPDGSKVYVVNSGNNTVSVINTSTNTVTNTITVGGQPMTLAVSPDGSKVFVAIYSGLVSVINTATNTISANISVGLGPRGIAVSSDGLKVYTMNNTENSISVISVVSNSVTATISAGSDAMSIALSPDNSRLYVANNGDNNVLVINTVTNSIIATVPVPVGSYPNGITVSPDGNKIYVANTGMSSVSVIEASTNTNTGFVAVGGSPFGIAVAPDGATVYVSNSSTNNISVIDAATKTVTNTIPVGTNPWGLGNFLKGAITCAGTPKTFTITVNPTPVVTSAAAGTVCSGVAQNYTITSAVAGATFNWSRAAVTGVSNTAATGSGTTITEALTNTTNAPVNVVYQITPSANGCDGPVFTYTVTVNPPAAVNSAATGTICSGVAQNYTITSASAGTTFTWSRAAVVGISNAAVSGQTTASITEALVNTTSAPIAVAYQITPSANGCPGTTFTYTVTVNPATAITTQPAAQSVCAGSNASFAVTATGLGITYQWRKDGVAITNATASTITINNATSAQVGNYDVVVSGGCGAVTSSAVALTIKPSTTITTEPTSQTVCTGASATFSVAAVGSGTLTYQWQKSGVAVGGNSTSYTIPSVTAADAGFYQVLVTGDCGWTFSTGVNLVVNPTTLITTQPVAKLACAGSSVIFSITASGTGLTYQWRKGGVNISNANSSTYTINNVSASDAANYDIVVSGACGTQISNAASLTVNTAPLITSQPASQVVCAGTSASFSVSATGTGLTYQWRKGGVNIANANSASYTINGVTTSEVGNYDVIVTGTCGTPITSATAALTLKTATAISAQPTAITVCEGRSASFAVTATGEGPLSYQWYKNGAIISGATNASYTIPAVIANLAGNYAVEVTAACGTITSSNALLTVNPLPTASVSGTTVVCQSATSPNITFTGSGGSAPYTFTYTVNGGVSQTVTTTIGNAVSVAVPTTTAGAFVYDLVSVKDASSTACTNAATGTATITVTPTPAASFSYSGSPFCTTGTASPSFSGTTGGTYTSTTGLSINSTTGMIDLSSSTPGSYTVTYTIPAAGGCMQVTTTASVEVKAPTVITTQPDSKTVCAGAGTTLSVSATGSGLTYQWRKAGAPIAGANSNTYAINPATIADAGSYDVVVTGDCGSVISTAVSLTVNTPVTITSQPVAKTICSGTPVSFSVTATGTGLSYQWRKGGVNINGATSAVYSIATPTATDADSYDVVVTGTCGAVISTASSLTVNAIPVMPTINTSSATTFCIGGSVTLTSSATTGNQWYKDGSAIGGATAQTYTATTSGNYTVQSIVNTCASPVSTGTLVTVNDIPTTPTVSASGALSFCSGGNVTLTSSATSGNQWYKDGVAISGATNATYTATTSGSYTVKTGAASCTSAASAATVVTVNALPATPTIAATGNILTSSAASGNQWYLNGVAITGATAQTHRVQAAGLYTVRVSSGSCASMSVAYNFVATRIDNPGTLNSEITVYPNPAVKTLFIKNTTARKLRIQLYDGFGRKVHESQLQTAQGTINVVGLANGVYQLVVTDVVKNQTITQSIIKL